VLYVRPRKKTKTRRTIFTGLKRQKVKRTNNPIVRRTVWGRKIGSETTKRKDDATQANVNSYDNRL
jgi:hypothetical protein